MRRVPHPPSEAATLLSRSRRVLLLLGPEARPALPELLQLAELLGAEILTTPDALSLVDGERARGCYSFGASEQAKAVVAAADVVVAVSPLDEFTCRAGHGFAHAPTIQVTRRAEHVGRNLQPQIALVGSVRESVGELLERTQRRLRGARPRWFEPQAHVPPITGHNPHLIQPADAIAALERALPEHARLCLDVTSGSLFATRDLTLRTTQRVFSSIERSGSMGEAFMASLGIRLASGLPTVALVGDWCYLMAASELHLGVEQRISSYVVLVWANGGGALVRTGVKEQRLRVPARAFDWQSPPRFAALARALGARGTRVSSAQALERALRRGLRESRPLLIEACIDSSVPPPAGDRFLTLGMERTSGD